MNTPWLTDSEIDELCEGLRQDAARANHLRSLGLTVTRKPNGRPLVMRAHAERVLSGDPVRAEAARETSTTKPNKDALILAFTRKAA